MNVQELADALGIGLLVGGVALPEDVLDTAGLIAVFPVGEDIGGVYLREGYFIFGLRGRRVGVVEKLFDAEAFIAARSG
jgi:hypothetical protein